MTTGRRNGPRLRLNPDAASQRRDSQRGNAGELSLATTRFNNDNLNLRTAHLSSPNTHVENRATMAAAIKALNARIRANPVSDYFCSTRESHPNPMEHTITRRVMEEHMRDEWTVADS